ncbi:MAG: DUF3892 domain-containing protein [Thermoplasmatales archaeon]|nr:DUF3892 domain-containing protein [Thermoplasmatales archaeon]
MAEYWVSHKRMNAEDTRINEVRAMMLTDNGLSSPLGYDREDVIQSLNNNDKWYTCLFKEERDGKNTWTKKAEIHIVEIDGENFIRTDRNKIKSDDLGELPEF